MSDAAPNKSQRKALVIGGLIVVLILLLLALRKRPNVNQNIEKYGDIVVDGPRFSNYDVPGLTLRDVWDWIHATDVGFMPGLPMRRAQAMPLSFDPLVLPVMVYVNKETPALPSFGGMPPAPTFDFPAWTAPPLPTWWYEDDYNVHDERAKFITTEKGISGTLGKYSRKNYTGPQTKNVVQSDGDIVVIDGVRYQHDKSKDNLMRLDKEFGGKWGPKPYTGGSFARS